MKRKKENRKIRKPSEEAKIQKPFKRFQESIRWALMLIRIEMVVWNLLLSPFEAKGCKTDSLGLKNQGKWLGTNVFFAFFNFLEFGTSLLEPRMRVQVEWWAMWVRNLESSLRMQMRWCVWVCGSSKGLGASDVACKLQFSPDEEKTFIESGAR
ncbi:hypothetical protein TWF694_000885 [Orbilia ellipsospora]|uniref:Uncharacterized protein n=1 Tax=Orbilia ellipsospora TaxID=2528407 RepID=A0AAV9XPZ3_9PEZI